MDTLQQLQNASTKAEVASFVNDITVLVQLNFKLDYLELHEWTNTHVYYTGVTNTNKLAVLEVHVETHHVYTFMEPDKGWVHVGKLIK